MRQCASGRFASRRYIYGKLKLFPESGASVLVVEPGVSDFCSGVIASLLEDARFDYRSCLLLPVKLVVGISCGRRFRYGFGVNYTIPLLDGCRFCRLSGVVVGRWSCIVVGGGLLMGVAGCCSRLLKVDFSLGTDDLIQQRPHQPLHLCM